MICNLVDNAIKLSDRKFHNKNIKIVKHILAANSYPKNLVEKHVKKRINKLNSDRDQNNNNCNTPINNRNNALPRISIPYIKPCYNRISNALKQMQIRTIPKINRNLSHVIKKGKDKSEKAKQNNVVYKLNCNDCDVVYVGQSKRAISVRVDEHKKSKNSVIYEHNTTNKHNFNWDNFEILDHEKNMNRRLVSEMIHINLQDKSINKIEDKNKLNKIYTQFFHKMK